MGCGELPSEIDAVIAAADAAVAEHGVPVLLVVDTLARHIDGDENAPVDMGLFIAACDGLRERYRCAVLIVHHSVQPIRASHGHIRAYPVRWTHHICFQMMLVESANYPAKR